MSVKVLFDEKLTHGKDLIDSTNDDDKTLDESNGYDSLAFMKI
jgi:hypothetical protein